MFAIDASLKRPSSIRFEARLKLIRSPCAAAHHKGEDIDVSGPIPVVLGADGYDDQHNVVMVDHPATTESCKQMEGKCMRSEWE